MIERTQHLLRVQSAIQENPIVGIIGARQVGKTTLAKQVASIWDGPVHFFDLEKPSDLASLAEPELTLTPLTGLVVLDEIQRLPILIPLLRVLADRPSSPARFLILGNASPSLLHKGNESLAGRITYHTLRGFAFFEVGGSALNTLWLRGGFPRSFLAGSDNRSWNWREDFIGTFLERDLPQLGVRSGASTMRTFWTMLAHYHGQIWNASELAQSLGVSQPTVNRHLDVLTSSQILRQLHPWHENLKKRQVKAQKIYFLDTGLLHTLLGTKTLSDLQGHPKLGASWEGFALSHVCEKLTVRPNECYFWATHGGAELDLLIVRGGNKFGFEFKRTSTPTLTRSMRIALTDLNLDQLIVVHPGVRSFPLAHNVQAVSINQLELTLSSLAV